MFFTYFAWLFFYVSEFLYLKHLLYDYPLAFSLVFNISFAADNKIPAHLLDENLCHPQKKRIKRYDIEPATQTKALRYDSGAITPTTIAKI